MRPDARKQLKALADSLPEDDVHLLVRLARGIFTRGRWGRRLVRDVEDRTDGTALRLALADPAPSIPLEEALARHGMAASGADTAHPRRRNPAKH